MPTSLLSLPLPNAPSIFTCQTSLDQSHLSFSKGQRQSFFIPCCWKVGRRWNSVRWLWNFKVKRRVTWLLVVGRPGGQGGGACRSSATGIHLKTKPPEVLESNPRSWEGCNWPTSAARLPTESATWLLPATMLGGHNSWTLPLCSTASLCPSWRIIMIVISCGVGDVKSIRLQLFLPPHSLWIPLWPPLFFDRHYLATGRSCFEEVWAKPPPHSLPLPPPLPSPCMREISCPLWKGDVLQLIDKQHRSCLHRADKETPESDPA